MTDEDQEGCEEYLELEQYIEELQAGRVAHLAANVTPEHRQIYRMAAFFHSASAGAASPDKVFVEALCAHLLTYRWRPSRSKGP